MSENFPRTPQDWENLKQEAIAGNIRIDEGVGDALCRTCKEYIDHLQKQQKKARTLGTLSGFGGLPSANDLKLKWEQKAVGGAEHDPNDSLVGRLQAHIDIAQLMHDYYAAAIGKYHAEDEEAARQLRAAGKGFHQ